MGDMGLLTTNEVATRLHVSPQTLCRWRQIGEGPPFVRLGPKTYRYPEAAVEEWLRNRESHV